MINSLLCFLSKVFASQVDLTIEDKSIMTPNVDVSIDLYQLDSTIPDKEIASYLYPKDDWVANPCLSFTNEISCYDFYDYKRALVPDENNLAHDDIHEVVSEDIAEYETYLDFPADETISYKTYISETVIDPDISNIPEIIIDDLITQRIRTAKFDYISTNISDVYSIDGSVMSLADIATNTSSIRNIIATIPSSVLVPEISTTILFFTITRGITSSSNNNLGVSSADISMNTSALQSSSSITSSTNTLVATIFTTFVISASNLSTVATSYLSTSSSLNTYVPSSNTTPTTTITMFSSSLNSTLNTTTKSTSPIMTVTVVSFTDSLSTSNTLLTRNLPASTIGVNFFAMPAIPLMRTSLNSISNPNVLFVSESSTVSTVTSTVIIVSTQTVYSTVSVTQTSTSYVFLNTLQPVNSTSQYAENDTVQIKDQIRGEMYDVKNQIGSKVVIDSKRGIYHTEIIDNELGLKYILIFNAAKGTYRYKRVDMRGKSKQKCKYPYKNRNKKSLALKPNVKVAN